MRIVNPRFLNKLYLRVCVEVSIFLRSLLLNLFLIYLLGILPHSFVCSCHRWRVSQWDILMHFHFFLASYRNQNLLRHSSNKIITNQYPSQIGYLHNFYLNCSNCRDTNARTFFIFHHFYYSFDRTLENKWNILIINKCMRP